MATFEQLAEWYERRAASNGHVCDDLDWLPHPALRFEFACGSWGRDLNAIRDLPELGDEAWHG